MSKEEWIAVYETIYQHQATIALQILEEKGIRAVIVNKRDSSYNSFGEIEVHVNQNNVIRAKQYLKDLES